MTLWDTGEFEALLQRAAPQHILIKRGRGRRRQDDSSEAKGRRAIRVAANGAYRKATSGLVSDAMRFDRDDDAKWATKLLPVAEDRDSAVSTPIPRPPTNGEVEAQAQADGLAADEPP